MPSRSDDLHPELEAVLAELIAIAARQGVPVRVTSKTRTLERQRELREAWEAGRSRFPANRPGDSAHNYGAAFDSVVPDWARRWWTALRERAGLRVPPNDWIHAEVPRWRELVAAGLLRPTGL